MICRKIFKNNLTFNLLITITAHYLLLIDRWCFLFDNLPTPFGGQAGRQVDHCYLFSAHCSLLLFPSLKYCQAFPMLQPFAQTLTGLPAARWAFPATC